MKTFKLFLFIFSFGIILYSCNSETKKNENGDPEVQQFMNTMQQGLDTNKAEVSMERDTTK